MKEYFFQQAQQPKPDSKPKPPASTPKEKPKVPAQSKLGGGKFNPNINMPTGGVKDD